MSAAAPQADFTGALNRLLGDCTRLVDAAQTFEARGRLVVEINKELDAIAEAEKFDLIVQQAIFASNAINLTDRVIKELAKRTAAAR